MSYGFGTKWLWVNDDRIFISLILPLLCPHFLIFLSSSSHSSVLTVSSCSWGCRTAGCTSLMVAWCCWVSSCAASHSSPTCTGPTALTTASRSTVYPFISRSPPTWATSASCHRRSTGSSSSAVKATDSTSGSRMCKTRPHRCPRPSRSQISSRLISEGLSLSRTNNQQTSQLKATALHLLLLQFNQDFILEIPLLLLFTLLHSTCTLTFTHSPIKMALHWIYYSDF